MSLIRKGLIASAIGLTLGLGACKKDFLERNPSDRVAIDSVFNTISGAEAAIQGLNRHMYRIPNDGREETFGQKGIDLMLDVLGDDIAWEGDGAGWFYAVTSYSSVVNGSAPVGFAWTFYYQMINNANRIIASIDDISDGSDEEKAVVKAQALAYRGYAYLNLVQLYQFPYIAHRNEPGVPVYTEPTREGKARASVQQVYTQIEEDLLAAESLFNQSGYSRNHFSDIDLSVVQGLLARTYLSKYDFAQAAQYAGLAKSNYNLMNSSQLLTGFNLANDEWMWGSALNDEQSAPFKSFLSHMDINTEGYASMSGQKLVNRYLYRTLMDENDLRKQWFRSAAGGGYLLYSQLKYKVRTIGSSATDLHYMRAAEMYFIEAEALAILGQTGPAADLLEQVMQTRIPGYTAPTDQVELIREILLNRRVELWGEGQRWFDIKRQLYYVAGPTNRINGLAVFSDNEIGVHRELAGGAAFMWGGNATIPGFLAPNQPHPLLRVQIPSSEINVNPLVERN